MYTYVCIYVCIHLSPSIYIHICTHIPDSTFDNWPWVARRGLFVLKSTSGSPNVCLSERLPDRRQIRIRNHVCMYIYIYIHMISYIHIYTM